MWLSQLATFPMVYHHLALHKDEVTRCAMSRAASRTGAPLPSRKCNLVFMQHIPEVSTTLIFFLVVKNGAGNQKACVAHEPTFFDENSSPASQCRSPVVDHSLKPRPSCGLMGVNAPMLFSGCQPGDHLSMLVV